MEIWEKLPKYRYGKVVEAEQELEKLKAQMTKTQSNNPMLKEEISSEDVAEVVARWTGIPVNKMLQSDREKLIKLEEELGKRVAGQKRKRL